MSARVVVLSWFALSLVCLGVGCSGPMHNKGDQRITVRGDYSKPNVSGRSGFGSGFGSAKNAGVDVAFEQYLEDGVAVVGGVGYRYFDQSDGAAHAGELEIGFRLFPVVLKHVSLSIDIVGGFMLSSRSVPEMGTHYNFLFGIGPTFEVRLSESVNLFAGYQFRHISNGLGSSDDKNPAQNDDRFHAGIAFKW